jgi:hypothetical protein
MRYNEESGALEENNFISSTNIAEIVELSFEELHVGNQRVHYLRPGSATRTGML